MKALSRESTKSDLGTARCDPTFTNLWVADSICGCKIFESILSGSKQAVERRPTDTERAAIIKSGNVFVYKERDNGIKRWTDGLHWSPSRISGNFLMYRQVSKPFPPGHKKKALKRRGTAEEEDDNLSMQRSNEGSDVASMVDGESSAPQTPQISRSSSSRQEVSLADKRVAERSLYGSLTKSYDFKPGGMMKKTMSVQVELQPYHLVAYYSPEDVVAGNIKDSTFHELLSSIRPRQELLFQPLWRVPLELSESPQTEAMESSQTFLHPPVPSHMHQTAGANSQYGYANTGSYSRPYGFDPQQASPSAFGFASMGMAGQTTYYSPGPYNPFPTSQPHSDSGAYTSPSPMTSGPSPQPFPPAYAYSDMQHSPASPMYTQGYSPMSVSMSHPSGAPLQSHPYITSPVLPSQISLQPGEMQFPQSYSTDMGSYPPNPGDQQSGGRNPQATQPPQFMQEPHVMPYQRAAFSQPSFSLQHPQPRRSRQDEYHPPHMQGQQSRTLPGQHRSPHEQEEDSEMQDQYSDDIQWPPGS